MHLMAKHAKTPHPLSVFMLAWLANEIDGVKPMGTPKFEHCMG